MKSIGIVGFGYVGKAVAKTFESHFHVYAYDPAQNFFHRDPVEKCDYLFVCVPTPMQVSGHADTSIVESVLNIFSNKFVIIKSTVPPGTCDRLAHEYHRRVVFSPEFAGEGKYILPWWQGYPHPTDPRYHNFCIAGGKPEDTHEVIQLHKPILGPCVQYLQTSAVAAELAKYMTNAWGAMKVTFANEFYELAKSFNVSYDNVRELVIATGFMEAMHSLVFEDNRGYGGKCLPKDLSAIIASVEDHGYDPKLLKQIRASNEAFRNAGNCT